MEHSEDITADAQLKNSKLTSLISKFPRVQNILITKNKGAVVKGMSALVRLICKQEAKIE